MLGKKCSLAPLKEELRIQGVSLCHHFSCVPTFDGSWNIEFSFILQIYKWVFYLCLFFYFVIWG